MKGNTEYKRRVHMIIHSIIHLESEYVLDKKYVRWGKVEADLFELEDAILTKQSSGLAKLVENQQDMPSEFNRAVDKMLDDELANR